MATLDSPAAPKNRIENAVQRELARRRRMLRLYLLLLLVPLGLAAWFLAAGRSDQETVRQAVEDRVSPVEQRYEQIAPKLEQVESLDEALPLVQQAAMQIQAQEKQFQSLQQQVEEIVPAMREIQSNQASLLRMERSGELKELAERLGRVEGGLQGIQERQNKIQRDLESVQLRIERQPTGPAFQMDPKRLNELIDARVHLLEQRSNEKNRDLPKDVPPPQ